MCERKKKKKTMISQSNLEREQILRHHTSWFQTILKAIKIKLATLNLKKKKVIQTELYFVKIDT